MDLFKTLGEALKPEFVTKLNLDDVIQTLFAVSARGTKLSFSELREKMAVQDNLMKQMETLAKEEKTLRGRIIRFPMADSYAVYVITKVNKKTVHISWIDYCDGWVDDRCGKECKINLDYAQKTIYGRDEFEKSWAKAK